ncbi:MAG: hypothetical protein NTX03_07265 [Bacteroidetes bacterium]|nr:hypothetical protein [Bacteroidota bacterium]
MMECTKKSYDSFRIAQEIINKSKKHYYTKDGQRINRLMHGKDKQLNRSYKCPYCEKWHITSLPAYISPAWMNGMIYPSLRY